MNSRTLEGPQRWCCSQRKELEPPSLRPHEPQAQRMWVSPLLSGTQRGLPAISHPLMSLLTCGQDPHLGRVLMPRLLRVTPSVLPWHLTPWLPEPLEETLGGLLPLLAPPMGIPGASEQQAGWLPTGPPSTAPSCPGGPSCRELVLCLSFLRGCGGSGHPCSPRPGLEVPSRGRSHPEGWDHQPLEVPSVNWPPPGL